MNITEVTNKLIQELQQEQANLDKRIEGVVLLYQRLETEYSRIAEMEKNRREVDEILPPSPKKKTSRKKK